MVEQMGTNQPKIFFFASCEKRKELVSKQERENQLKSLIMITNSPICDKELCNWV